MKKFNYVYALYASLLSLFMLLYRSFYRCITWSVIKIIYYYWKVTSKKYSKLNFNLENNFLQMQWQWANGDLFCPLLHVANIIGGQSFLWSINLCQLQIIMFNCSTIENYSLLYYNSTRLSSLSHCIQLKRTMNKLISFAVLIIHLKLL